jgi:hypothetical protein
MSEPLSPAGYVATGGTVCPSCGGGTFHDGPLRNMAGVVLQGRVCYTCQASWMNVYELRGYELFGLPRARERTEEQQA